MCTQMKRILVMVLLITMFCQTCYTPIVYADDAECDHELYRKFVGVLLYEITDKGHIAVWEYHNCCRKCGERVSPLGDEYIDLGGIEHRDEEPHIYVDGFCSVCGRKAPSHSELRTEEPAETPFVTTEPVETLKPTKTPRPTTDPKPTATPKPMCNHNYERIEVGSPRYDMSASNNSKHAIVVTYYEQCTLCGDKTANMSEITMQNHSLAKESYEAEHPHKIFQDCKVCGYAVYTERTKIVAGCAQCNPPITPKPVTPAPVTPAPATPAPTTPMPVTPTPVVTAAPSDDKTIKKGESDKEKVKELQGLLCKNGYILSVDGSFGPNTEGNVKKFQKDYSLEVTGIADAATWRALREHATENANKLHENRNDAVDGDGRLTKIDKGKAGINTPHYYYDAGVVGDDPENTKKIYRQFDVEKNYGDGAYCNTFASTAARAMGAFIPTSQDSMCLKCGKPLTSSGSVANDYNGMSEYLESHDLICKCGSEQKKATAWAFNVNNKKGWDEVGTGSNGDVTRWLLQYGSEFGWKEVGTNTDHLEYGSICEKGKNLDQEVINAAIGYALDGKIVVGVYSDYAKGAGHAFLVYPNQNDTEKLYTVQVGAGGATRENDTNGHTNTRNSKNPWIRYFVFEGLDN